VVAGRAKGSPKLDAITMEDRFVGLSSLDKPSEEPAR